MRRKPSVAMTLLLVKIKRLDVVTVSTVIFVRYRRYRYRIINKFARRQQTPRHFTLTENVTTCEIV